MFARQPLVTLTVPLTHELHRLRAAWRKFRRDRDRDSIYPFLAEVFGLVAWWKVENRSNAWSCRLIKARGIVRPRILEPYHAVIVAAVHPTILDKRTISKWSRVLRYAGDCKSVGEGLAAFVKRKGGLNECAARYSRRLRRRKVSWR